MYQAVTPAGNAVIAYTWNGKTNGLELIKIDPEIVFPAELIK